jgi:hypothetical protein
VDTNNTGMSSGSNNESTNLKKIYVMFGIFAFLLITWVVYTQVTKSKNSTEGEVSAYCEFDNQKYDIGEVFNVDCNTCVCTQTGISCTFKICDQKCIDSDSQCKGMDDGSLCILGVWCDENGKACGGESCTDLGLGICIKEKCVGE